MLSHQMETYVCFWLFIYGLLLPGNAFSHTLSTKLCNIHQINHPSLRWHFQISQLTISCYCWFLHRIESLFWRSTGQNLNHTELEHWTSPIKQGHILLHGWLNIIDRWKGNTFYKDQIGYFNRNGHEARAYVVSREASIFSVPFRRPTFTSLCKLRVTQLFSFLILELTYQVLYMFLTWYECFYF